MADKPQGNLLYEILIVILAILLIFTILYPQKVWQREDIEESICRARMEAILNLELQYMNQVWTYSDSLEKVKQKVLEDPNAVSGLDSLVMWEDLVARNDLKSLVDSKSFPKDLRALIGQKLNNGESLRNLGQYDSLDYKLIQVLHSHLEDTTGEQIAVLDTNIQWATLIGERDVLNLIDAAELSRSVRRNALAAVRDGKPVEETRAWKRMYPAFYQELRGIIQTSSVTDIWEKKDQDEWKEMKRAEWEADLDTLSIEEQDSLWAQNQKDIWDNGKEIIWREDSKKLWKAEKESWAKENEALWMGDISRKWEADRKKEWISLVQENPEKQIAFWLSAQIEDSMDVDEYAIEDSSYTPVALDTAYEADAFFKENRDSLWREELTIIREQEYEPWLKKNKKYISEVIESMWQNDRRLSWESERFEAWVAEKDANKEDRWIELKDFLWKNEWMELWKDEEIKVSRKQSALRRLDLAVQWIGILDAGTTESLVVDLDLPDNSALWKKVTAKTDEKGSKLYKLGVVPLFREVLLESVDTCPVANVPYLIHVDDTSALKKVKITCPISTTDDLSVSQYKYAVEETESAVEEEMVLEEAGEAMMEDTTIVVADEGTEEPVEAATPKKSSKSYTVALKVDPVTKDTSKTVLSLPLNVKLFGGGAIRNHGNIDIDKKSWQKKGR